MIIQKTEEFNTGGHSARRIIVVVVSCNIIFFKVTPSILYDYYLIPAFYTLLVTYIRPIVPHQLL